jgi:hypothetical protein
MSSSVVLTRETLLLRARVLPAHVGLRTCSVRAPSYGTAVRRLRELSEAECYARCYGASDDGVRIVKIEPRRSRYSGHLSGEELRRLFELRLDARQPEAA